MKAVCELALAGLLGLGSLPSCEAQNCAAIALWSFRVRVSDSVTNEPICDASLTSNDGKTEIPLTSVGGSDCVYVGVAEQLGTFQVSIGKAGYQPTEITVVVDEEDECHVITKDVSATLVPE